MYVCMYVYRYMQAEVSKFAAVVNKMTAEVKRCESIPKKQDLFYTVMNPFCKQLTKISADYTNRVKVIKTKSDSLIKSYGQFFIFSRQISTSKHRNTQTQTHAQANHN